MDRVVDIHLHDTYYVILAAHLIWILAVFLGINWMMCMLAQKIFISKVLTGLHAFLSILSCLTFMALLFINDRGGLTATRRYVDPGFSNIAPDRGVFQITAWIAVSAMVLGWGCYFANVFAGLFQRMTRRS